MPPLPGGSAAKVGLRFEDRWTAHCAMQVLHGEADAIYLEKPGGEDDGFEFRLERDSTTEHHQVKRQTPGEGGWTIKSLAAAGVLRAFFERLQDPQAICVFASANAAQALDELATSARAAPSQPLFDRDYLGAKTRRSQYGTLKDVWDGASDSWIYEALQRVRVENIGEPRLEYMLQLEAELLFSASHKLAPAQLIQILRDRVNHRLLAVNLWTELEKAGLRPNPWRSKADAAAVLGHVNERFRRSREMTLVANQLIPRTETEAVLEQLRSRSVVVVEGDAGSGKSDVLLELTRHFENNAQPYLAFRLDRQRLQGSAEVMGHELGLAGSPPAVLRAAAKGAPCVLVIDQLDAVSTVSGRGTEALETVDELLRLAETQPQMKVVLACRSFDLSHDARLRRLVVEGEDKSSVKVGLLPLDRVDQWLGLLGVPSANVDADLRELLRVPLHLSLLGQLSSERRSSLHGVRTLGELYAQFWDSKQEQIQSALGREPRWLEILDVLADNMSDHARLQAPRALVDAWPADVRAMLSASVLLADEGQLAFFHETFFDYVFARRFAARGKTLRNLFVRDQFLFRRAQVRQILAFARSAEPQGYLDELRFVLFDKDVRFHIKELVLSWLGALPDPRDAEWNLLSKLIARTPEAIAGRARRAILGSGWFSLLDRHGLVEEWLVSVDERELGLAVARIGQAVDPARSAELLEAHRHRSEEAADEVSRLLQRSDLSTGRETFDLFLDLLARDATDLGRRDFWFVAHDLPSEHPDWGCELLGAYLANRVRAADASDTRNPFDYREGVVPRQLYLREFVTECAAGAPKEFLDHVFPLLVDIANRTGRQRYDDELVEDDVWNQPHLDDHYGDLEDQLLLGAEAALRALAQAEPDDFRALVAQHRGSKLETVAHWLFEGFRANPKELSDEAVGFLLVEPRRLRVGRSSDDHWGTRLLLAEVTPYCSDEWYLSIESLVLDYYTSWERSASGRQARGYAQFTLLGALPEGRLSPLARRRLGEWQRKFQSRDADEPFGIQGGVVGSPIPDRATELMKDWQWLRAFARYDRDDSDRRDFLKGGAHQLSSQLEARASEDPVRFVGLALQMPDTVHTYYFDAILRGVAKSDLEVPLASRRDLVVRCHALPAQPCGRWICHPLRALVDAPLPNDLAHIVGWYASEHPDPAPKEYSISGDMTPEERLESSGLNSVRGGTAYEMAPHIFRHQENVEALLPAMRSLVTDPSDSVQAMAARPVAMVLRHDESTALDCFLTLTDSCPDSVLATRYFREFLRYRAQPDFAALEPVLTRMIESDNPRVRNAGAVHIALAALEEEAAQNLLDICLAGDDPMRKGVAHVAAANLTGARYRSRWEDLVVEFFSDPAPEVREAASTVFTARDKDTETLLAILTAPFVASPAFNKHAELLLRALERATGPSVEITLMTCEQIVGALDPSAIGDTAEGLGHDLSEIIVRAYADAGDDVQRNRALDLIDLVLQADAYGLTRALLEHDRGR